MDLASIFSLGQTALELGLICSLTVLALFLSYSMLNVCDLSTDGCFTLGAAVGAAVAIAGHPYLSVFAAMAAGALSGLIVAILQTKMGINSLLAGIIVNTALYSVNITVMGEKSILNLNKTATVFTEASSLLKKIGLTEVMNSVGLSDPAVLAVALTAVLLVSVLLVLFLKTKLGLAIRATGNNPDMVRSSSIDPTFTTVAGLCVSNSITALSGCLLAQSQKSVNIDIGTGMVTVALASLLIGGVFCKTGKLGKKVAFMTVGALIFRTVYAAALRLKMPTHMLKLVSSVIVIIAIFVPYFKDRLPMIKRRFSAKKGGGVNNA